MSSQITTAFVNQFSSNVQLLSQQRGSLLRGSVSEEAVTGEKAFFDQVGATAAVKRTSRHQDTQILDTPHSRRMVTMDSYEWADLIDDADKITFEEVRHPNAEEHIGMAKKLYDRIIELYA